MVDTHIPLATRLRPQTLNEFFGQTAILSPGKPLRRALEQGELHSMIFWGPPGTGKTTLAQIAAQLCHAQFISLSAVMAGVKDVREAVELAKEAKQNHGQHTILFLDEVHRFNKAQQDAFLPYVENGVFTFIGATTENPSFALNNALLSRAKVYIFKPLDNAELQQILNRGIEYLKQTENITVVFPEELALSFVSACDGDARQVLNQLELIAQFSPSKAKKGPKKVEVTKELLAQIWSDSIRRFDKSGDEFYEQISALHKSVRGSSPDGALYWLCRMLDGGCDPYYIARRIVRMASEDIGNADPRGLELALNAWDAYHRLGSPEGELALAQAVVYLAVAPKSIAVYKAFGEVMQDVKSHGTLPVPIHLRNAPTQFMKGIGYGKEYRYDPEEKGGISLTQTYFPDEMEEKIYYHPSNNGLEIKIAEKLAEIRKAKEGNK